MVSANGELALLVVLGAKLTPMQLDVFLDVHLLGRSTTALAPEYGCSRSAVHQAEQRAKVKLAQKFSARLAA